MTELNPLVNHGNYGYDQGCRCPICKKARSDADRRYRARIKGTPKWEEKKARDRLYERTRIRIKGVCVDCGGPTSANSSNDVSLRCHSCHVKKIGQDRRGSGKQAERIVELLRNGPMRSKDIQEQAQVSATALMRLSNYGVIQKIEKGVYCLPNK